jgi:hypothetical protein
MDKCMGLIAQHAHVSDCSTGRKSSLIQETSFCLVWGTRFMQPVHFVLIMVPRSSKASSQLMAGSCGEISENISYLNPSVLISWAQSVAWGYIITANHPFIRYAHVIGVACFNVCTGDIGLPSPVLSITSSCSYTM